MSRAREPSYESYPSHATHTHIHRRPYTRGERWAGEPQLQTGNRVTQRSGGPEVFPTKQRQYQAQYAQNIHAERERDRLPPRIAPYAAQACCLLGTALESAPSCPPVLRDTTRELQTQLACAMLLLISGAHLTVPVGEGRSAAIMYDMRGAAQLHLLSTPTFQTLKGSAGGCVHSHPTPCHAMLGYVVSTVTAYKLLRGTGASSFARGRACEIAKRCPFLSDALPMVGCCLPPTKMPVVPGGYLGW